MGCKIVADDYGMAEEVNSAISELVKRNIVSKVGIMVNETINYSAGSIRDNVEVGLHINLLNYEKGRGIDPNKEASPLKFLYTLYTEQIKTYQIIDNINLQLEFLRSKGFKISHIDTHLHIHVFPKLSRLIINYAKVKGIDSIRCITMQRRHLIFYINSLVRFGFLSQLPKIIFLYSIGGMMKSMLDMSQIKYCKNLVLMPLAKNGDYSGLLKVLLKRFKNEDSEIVTHPGFEAKVKFDKYTTGRYVEFQALINQKKDNCI